MQKRKTGEPRKGWKDAARKRHEVSSQQHELVPFLAMWAVDYAKFWKLDGLHPTHYDLMKKYGARMNDFKRATDND